MHKCIVLFSGGLDSVIAAHLMRRQGVAPVALHFILPFDRHAVQARQRIRSRAQQLDIPWVEYQEDQPFVDMVAHAASGYGKHVNPCIDCRILRLRHAAALMSRYDADFLVTGEVVGQRPMSQRRDALMRIEKHSELKGMILRPLSAGLLPETIAEQRGWVDRSQLWSLSGRSRKPQMAYAHEHGLSYDTPAGGCLLTQPATAARIRDLQAHTERLTVTDFEAVAVGRHFRLSPEAKLIVGRDRGDNDRLTALAQPDDHVLQMVSPAGPCGLVRGTVSAQQLEHAAAITARFSKGKHRSSVSMDVCTGHGHRSLTVTPASPQDCDRYRIE
jgi:tRNA U34 2-thiouridine synthase MnmA/TrmU